MLYTTPTVCRPFGNVDDFAKVIVCVIIGWVAMNDEKAAVHAGSRPKDVKDDQAAE